MGVSRFRTRNGCYLYGVLRQSDFLPVGADKEEEHWERGYDSLNSSDSGFEGHRHMGYEDSDFEEGYDIDYERDCELNRPPAADAVFQMNDADFDDCDD